MHDIADTLDEGTDREYAFYELVRGFDMATERELAHRGMGVHRIRTVEEYKGPGVGRSMEAAHVLASETLVSRRHSSMRAWRCLLRKERWT